jgi:outer membrane protein OmpA-like peptidoglycan-associated protein
MATFVIGTGCASLKKNKNAAIGAGAGIAIGGAIGALIGKKNDNTAGGVIIGAAVGGVAGGAIGKYMDKQKRELEEKLGNSAEVERVGEGIKVTFDSGLLFAFNSSELTAAMKTNLRDFAETLKTYDKTVVLIDGHTDSKGSEEYNLKLSDRRAKAVSNYLNTAGVSNSRLGTRGFGESKPVGSNETEQGRKQNRRVEVAIWADDELKKQAQEGQIK